MGKRRRKKVVKRGGGEVEGMVVEEIDADDGLLWVQEVQIRPKSQRRPMSQRFRWRKNIESREELKFVSKNVNGLAEKAMAEKAGQAQDDLAQDDPAQDETERATPKKSNLAGVDSDSDDDDSAYFDYRKQFTVTSIKREINCMQRILSIFNPNVDDFSYRPSRLFVEYINWTFRSGFGMVFITFLSMFMVLTLIFGGFLLLAGNAEPGCIIVSGEQWGVGTNPDTEFADAYALSWTTFTTVGYGMTYTSTGVEKADQKACWIVVGLCTAESFVGLLYAGMCAAILFGKIGRIQSHAQVCFSNAICITFGLGAQAENGAKRESTSDIAQAEDGRRIPCPVLSFQIMNTQCNNIGGEIMDANIRMVATNHDDGTGSCVAMYKKVQLTEFEHPFFSRVWQGRHVLNATSPLLNPFAKSMIRQNGGYWPADWNNAKDVKNALQFTDLIATITGISNVSASTVHAYKKFKSGDVLIGYEFASVLYKHPDSRRIKVDKTLVNDVIEQAGGGAEEFGDDVDDDEHSWGSPSVHVDPSKRCLASGNLSPRTSNILEPHQS